MTHATYDAAVGRLPGAPQGMRVVSVRFLTCPSTSLALRLHGVVGDANVDARGMSANSWWTVRCTGLPDRHIRLYKGSHSLSELLRRYAFQDANGCVNPRRVTVAYDAASATRNRDAPACVAPHLRDATGIPQFYPRSGVCWFATMCGTAFMNKQVRDIILAHLPAEDADIRDAGTRCHHDRDAAEVLRKRLWYKYGVGDDVDEPPEKDGKNGFAEFALLAAKLGIPLVRYKDKRGTLERMDPRVYPDRDEGDKRPVRLSQDVSKPHLLVLRYRDGNHQKRHPVERRVHVKGKRYRLVGVYMGQMKCGHQIGLTSPTGEWRDGVIVDADLHKDGISPVFVRFEGDKWVHGWWKAWRDLVHITKYGMGNSEFCNLSPWNPDNRSLDVFQDADGRASAPAPSTRNGTNSLDLVYVLCENQDC